MKIAHVAETPDGMIVQDLKEHLEHVAELSGEYMRPLGCPSMGYLTGLIHDIQKSGKNFQDRMEAILSGKADPGQKGGHASGGAVLLNRIAEDMGGSSGLPEAFALQAICEAVFSHHTSLPDNVSPGGEDGYLNRMNCEAEELKEMECYLWEEVISKEKFHTLLRQVYVEAEELLKKVRAFTEESKEIRYCLGTFEKMLLSSLIDADWLDSALSREGGSSKNKAVMEAEVGCREEREWLFKYFLRNLEDYLQERKVFPGKINLWRNYISENCKEAGNRTGGIYTLPCPTGAGKTLASLRFALSHCVKHKKRKIFYIIPFLSIIDQTAKSIKAALKNGDSDIQVEKNILELHSNAEMDQGGGEPGGEDFKEGNYQDRSFWAQRMWEPVVLTTMVRFLNTFFAAGTRNLRPAHQFQDAVIIFDEIQTLPIKQIAVFNSLINFLSEICGCTCVLCTATQPLLGELSKPVYPARLASIPKLTEIPREALEDFKRVRVENRLKRGGYSGEELGWFAWDKAMESESVLVIMNTKQSALTVYREILRRSGEDLNARQSGQRGISVYYLSTRLYAAHRKELLNGIREALAAKEKIIVVSTQLIEAGIDFDFHCVIRSLAGMDSVVQAAGRCNREGKREMGVTYIVNPDSELESLAHLRDIREGAKQTERVLGEFDKDPDSFDNDLLSEKAMHSYFMNYFWVRKGEMTYPIPEVSEYTLYDLISDNISLVRSAAKHKDYQTKPLNQAFRTATRYFNVIEEVGDPVFVRRGRGQKIWEEVQRASDYGRMKELLKEAQQYVVNVPLPELKKLGESRGVMRWEDKMGMYVLNEMYYDDKTGLSGETGDTMPQYVF